MSCVLCSFDHFLDCPKVVLRAAYVPWDGPSQETFNGAPVAAQYPEVHTEPYQSETERAGSFCATLSMCVVLFRSFLIRTPRVALWMKIGKDWVLCDFLLWLIAVPNLINDDDQWFIKFNKCCWSSKKPQGCAWTGNTGQAQSSCIG